MKFPKPKISKENLYTASAAAILVVVLGLVFSSEEFTFTQAQGVKQKNIVLSSSTISNTEITPGQPVTFTASLTNTSRIPQRVLVDIEIFDANNNRVMQRYWDNVRIIKGKQVTYEVKSPAELGPGQYKFWVGVFEPKWGRLLNSFDAGFFNVSELQNDRTDLSGTQEFVLTLYANP